MSITIPPSGIIVSKVTVDGNDFNEVQLFSEDVPLTTTGTEFQLTNISSSNLQDFSSEIVTFVNTPNLIQSNLVTGTDLLVTNTKLPLNVGQTVSNGSGFSISGTDIIMVNPGLYKVSWSVLGELSGPTFVTRRRLLRIQPNKNSGTLVTAAQTSDSCESVAYKRLCSVTGNYIINTTSSNETIALQSEDLSQDSTQGITFQTVAGFLKVERLNRIN